MTHKSNYVFEDMMNKILIGQYELNHKLPTERELSIKYNTSRYVVRKALKSLESINFIECIQGSGNFVTLCPSHHFRYNNYLSRRYHDISSKAVSFTCRNATPEEIMLFGLNNGKELWDFKRIRMIDFVITRIEHTIMPKELLPHLSKEIIEKSIHAYVLKQGHVILKTVKKLSPVNVDKETAILLCCKPGKAAMKTKNTGILSSGKLFEITESIEVNYSCTHVSDFDYAQQTFRSERP